MLLIIGIIISVVTVAFMLMTNNSYNEKTFTIRAITLIVGTGIVVTSWVVSSEITERKEEYKLVESQNIVALQDNSNTSGRFLLGSGTVNGSMYYCYYIDADDGYKYQQINTSDYDVDVSIKYCNENETPHIEKYDKYTIPTSSTKWGWVFNPVLIAPRANQSVLSTQKIYIYLPKGTIDENYKVDLQ